MLLLPTTWTLAEDPLPKPTPAKPKAGYIRFWNVLPPKDGPSFDLVLGGNSDGRVLNTAAPSNFYANYVSLPPGRCTLRVYRAGERQNVLKNIDLSLRDKSYYTLIASPQPGGQPSLDLIDDTPDPTKPPVNRVTVRQFCPDTSVVIAAGSSYRTDSLDYSKTQTIEGMPDGKVALTMRATKSGNSAVKTWDTQADFSVSHHSTVFVVNDLYGRIRARVAMDGPSPADEEEAAADAKNKP